MKHWTKDDIGCWADGAGGQEHIRDVLAGLVVQLPLPESAQEVVERGVLVAALESEMSDDAWEEDEAIELLNANTEEGLMWGMCDGDLMLQTSDWEGWEA